MIDKNFVRACQAFIEPNRFRLDEPMKLHTTFKIGGPADCLIFPASMEETEKVLALVNEYKLPLTILGNGSNVLVQDKGIRGVVVKFARPMAKIRHEGTRIIAGAGALLKDVSEAAAQSSLTGLEFACGIPGSIGGAIFMNAGAYDGEMKNVADTVRTVDREGRIHTYSRDELDLGYRHVCNSKRPIRTIEDLKGLKIRVPNNPVMINTFRAWGCEPTPLAWDETFNALQQKVVDGQENSYVVFASNKFEEVQKYMTELRYKLQIIVMVVNETWLKKQPADIQQAILEGGRLATKHNREMIMAMEARLKPAMKKAGVEILDKPEDENVWEEKAMALWPDLYPKIGNLDLLDKMMADMHRKRP